MRYLITGGAGYIGSRLVDFLSRRDDTETIVVCDPVEARRDAALRAGATHVAAPDLEQPRGVRAVPRDDLYDGGADDDPVRLRSHVRGLRRRRYAEPYRGRYVRDLSD